MERDSRRMRKEPQLLGWDERDWAEDGSPVVRFGLPISGGSFKGAAGHVAQLRGWAKACLCASLVRKAEIREPLCLPCSFQKSLFHLSSCCMVAKWVSDSFVTPWTVALQAPLSVEFSRQECWSGLWFPSWGALPHPVIEPTSAALSGGFFTSEPPGKPAPLPFVAEAKWNPGQLGPREVMALATRFLSLWQVLIPGLTQPVGELLTALNRKGQNGNIQVEFTGLSLIRFSPRGWKWIKVRKKFCVVVIFQRGRRRKGKEKVTYRKQLHNC